MTQTDIDPENGTATRPRKRISYVRWTISILIMVPVVFIWILFLQGGLLNFQLVSGSMEPTLEVGDRVLVKTGELPQDLRGYVVCLRAPDNAHELLAKRVIGQAGDRIRLKDGEVYLNGSQEPIEGETIHGYRDKSWEVGPDQVFVLGDNRNNSNDSKDWGPISRENVVGLVWFRYYPLNSISWIR